MRPTALINLLAKTIAAGLPVLIKGAPGCGKSDIVAAAADAAGADVVLFHPVVSDPTDFKGLPAIVNAARKAVGGKTVETVPTAQFLPFGDLERLIHAKALTIAFLDDLGQAPAVVQAAAMQLILARQINGHRISDKVVFIAATNRREDRAGVTGILEPVKSRFATIVELNPHVDDWCAWALANNVPPVLVAFVRFRPELMTSPGVVTNDIVNRPSPRTVTNMGKLYAAGISDLESLQGAVGAGFATEFIGFIRVWQNLPSIDAILVTPETAPVPNEPAALYAIATALATRVTAANAGRVLIYLNRLPEEFGVLGVRDCLRACPAASANREFVKWAVDHQGMLA